MPVESVETLVIRLDERLARVLKELEDSKDARKDGYESMEAMRLSLHDIGNRVANVESQLAGNQPTIQEFVTIKNKVIGAGKLGKWLWALGGLLLGLAAAKGKFPLHQWLRLWGPEG